MAQLMTLPLTISCSSKSRLVLPLNPDWFYLSGAGSVPAGLFISVGTTFPLSKM